MINIQVGGDIKNWVFPLEPEVPTRSKRSSLKRLHAIEILGMTNSRVKNAGNLAGNEDLHRSA